VAGAAELRLTTWLTDWLVLAALTLFLMRKSMDAVQQALADLPELERPQPDTEAWIHHDVHFFTQFGREPRRPAYRDGSNAIAAFDVALGHRVYLHPFFWSVALLGYLFLLGWALLVPEKGAVVGTVAALMPATAALLLMSGGVAVSFGWERDRGRWPALAVLPVGNLALGWGKILGVVRPTLWLGLMASMTALVLGWRGALDPVAALWMALHVLLFPVVLACVAAALALTTPTLAEALYRWAVFGAIPAAGALLPPPIGGEAGLALPFSPPLLVLLLVVRGTTPALLRGAAISLALEVAGFAAALLILHFLLRRLTVGERP